MNIRSYSPFTIWAYIMYPNVEINLRYYEDGTSKFFVDKNRSLIIYHKYNIKDLHLYKTKELLNILWAPW